MKNLFLVILFFSFIFNLQAQNPFSSLGVKDSEVPILSISKGKYEEIIPNDTLIKIGSVVVNTITGKIEYFVQIDTVRSESNLEPQIVSKWLSPDPVFKAYESPYVGMGNNPIWFCDPDGADIIPTNAFSKSPYYPVFRVIHNNSIYIKYVTPFIRSKTTNVTFDYAAIGQWNKTAYGITQTDKRNPTVSNIYFQPGVTEQDPKDNGFMVSTTRISDITKYKTMVHELMHAYISAQGLDLSEFKGSKDPEHEYIAKYLRGDLLSGIKEFASENNISITDEEADALSWSGLQDTKEWYKTDWARDSEKYKKVFARISQYTERYNKITKTASKETNGNINKQKQ